MLSGFMINTVRDLVQWLRLRAPNAGSPDSIPGWGTEILHAELCGLTVLKRKAVKSPSGRYQFIYLFFVENLRLVD